MDLNIAHNLPDGTPVTHRRGPGVWRGVDKDDPSLCWIKFNNINEFLVSLDRAEVR